MCMSRRNFKINDKTQFLFVFGHFFGRENDKNSHFQTIIFVVLFTLYYYKQYNVHSFWMVGEP